MARISKENERLRQRNRVSGATSEGISATTEKTQPSFWDDVSHKNVGVYARVSTDNSQQTLSYEMQQKYYSEMVDNRPNWTLEKIYADEGVTGTSTKRRASFNEMISDCKKGKIDLVVTKSVSRFSRNILDAISYVRELAALNPPVAVYFENEGIYTLSPDGEMRLTYTAANAQEESRIRSVAMNSSIVMRFSNGMFLTPPLLGFDNGENGELIINEDEAVTVRLIFCMYLTGKSTGEIAKALEELGRRTKKGRIKWSAGSVYSQLTNERHCGMVKGRKTWTPNYLDHLSKKNRTYADGITDKKQYTCHNHHEPIVSPDDFAAVQKIIANAKHGNRNYLPQLQVITGGTLHGFVSINPYWAAFSAEDYIAASLSAGEIPVKNAPKPMAKQGDIDLRDVKLLRGDSFVDAFMICATFAEDRLRFSSTCVRKFSGKDYVEILIHPIKKLLAVRPCRKEHKNAIRWTSHSDGRAFGRSIGCSAYINTLYSLLEWESSTRYRLRCALQKVEGEPIAIFDASVVSKTCIQDYYDYIHRQPLQPSRKTGEITMYNANPDINPTSENSLLESITQITEKLRSVGNGN